MSKKTSFVFALLAAAGLGAVAAQTAQAGVIWYTDRAAWMAAAGSPTCSEDFESFPFDTLFRAAPVALNGMSIR
jgi:hypothetical protein